MTQYIHLLSHQLLTQNFCLENSFFQRSEVVEYSFPFDRATFKIVIKAIDNKFEWETYKKGEKLRANSLIHHV